VSPSPRAFFAIDLGTATTSVALVARLAGRWRLLGSLAFPSGVEPDQIAGLLLSRIARADPPLAAELGIARSQPDLASRAEFGDPLDLAVSPHQSLGPAGDWPRIVSRSFPTRKLVVLAAGERRRTQVETALAGSGWRTASLSMERDDPLQMMTAALDADVGGVVIAAGASVGPDERRGIRLIADLLSAVIERRPELSIVLVGGASEHVPGLGARRRSAGRAGALIALPEGVGSEAADERLRGALARVATDPADARLGIVRSTASLATVLDRRVETVEIGLTAGVRAVAGRRPGHAANPRDERTAIVPEAGLASPEPESAQLDGIVAWSTVAIDRPRLRDRLRELWLAPWAEAYGDGAVLRLAAARGALERLVAATPVFSDLPVPDLILASGGVWSIAPPAAVALAILDILRRPGVTQLAYDHARLLGPIGTIEDEAERRVLLAELAEDLLSPLATAVVPQGLSAGRAVGRLVLHAGATPVIRDLVGGHLELVELPPGMTRTAELEFRDGVVLGGRGRRFALEVGGGLGGLLVDLRDVPLQLPESPDRRREALSGWQQATWSELAG
jgi:hypothetical protein